MTIKDYIREKSDIGDVVIVYSESGYYSGDVDLDFEWEEKDEDDFESEEDYDDYNSEIEVQKELADALIEKAQEAYQCDSDEFEDMVNEIYINPCVEGAADPDTIYRYFDYDRFRNDLLVYNYFYSNGYYFLAY